MRQFFVIQGELSTAYWSQNRSKFMSSLYWTEYPTLQAAFTGAEKIPKGIVFSIKPLYVNE